jgi:AcrR family transcriptional regulator
VTALLQAVGLEVNSNSSLSAQAPCVNFAPSLIDTRPSLTLYKSAVYIEEKWYREKAALRKKRKCSQNDGSVTVHEFRGDSGMPKKRQRIQTDMKLAILKATNELAKTIKIDDIGIVDICNAAFISKQTFYRYFDSKFDVLRWYQEYVFKIGNFRMGRDLNIYDAQLITASGMLMVRVLLTALYPGRNDERMSSFGVERARYEYGRTVSECHGIVIDERLRYQLEAFALSQTAMVRVWVANGMTTPPEALSGYLESIVPAQLGEILNTPVQKYQDPV